MLMKDSDKTDHIFTADIHDSNTFPEDTPDALIFTAGDANDSWAKAQSGVASEAGSATSLTDGLTDFIAIGARVGQTISNTTDGSSATITVVEEHTITCEELTGGADDTWENADEWSIAVVNGWVEVLDSGDNKLTASFPSKGHITAIDVDQVNVADKAYILEIGIGLITEDVTVRRAILRFISAVAGVNFQTPKHYSIRSSSLNGTKKIYYRMKCETGGSTMNGSMRFYLD